MNTKKEKAQGGCDRRGRWLKALFLHVNLFMVSPSSHLVINKQKTKEQVCF